MHFILSGALITDEFINELNQNCQAICQVEKLESLSILPSNFIEILALGIVSNSLYDSLKYILLGIFSLLSVNKKDSTIVKVSCNGKKYQLAFSYKLTNAQKDQLLESILKKITDA